MQTISREVTRKLILTTAEAALPQGVTIPLISVVLSGHQIKLSDGEILSEVQYLMDKGLMHLEPKTLSPENKVWRCSASGRDYLATEGLA